jgi:hypothetical protein
MVSGSSSQRVRPRWGAVQNERFSGSHSRQFAPGWASSQKNPEKIVKEVGETGAKRRFSEGRNRHFAVLGADGPGSQAAKLPAFTSVDSGCLQPPAARRTGDRAPFFTHWGANRHGCDRRDLTIALILLRGLGSPRGPCELFLTFQRVGRLAAMRAPARRRVARETRAVCSSDAARWRIGRKKGHRPMRRSVAELPGDPSPQKETDVIAVYRWVLAVCPMVLKLSRQSTVTSLGFLSIVFFLRAKATDTRSISLLDPIKDNLGFGDVKSCGPENSGFFCGFCRLGGL